MAKRSPQEVLIPQGIQPQAQSFDQFELPSIARPAQGLNQLQQLTAGLARFNPALQQHLHHRHLDNLSAQEKAEREQQEKDEREAQQAYLKNQGKQLSELVREGVIPPGASPVFQRKFLELQATSRVQQARAEALAAYQESGLSRSRDFDEVKTFFNEQVVGSVFDDSEDAKNDWYQFYASEAADRAIRGLMDTHTQQHLREIEGEAYTVAEAGANAVLDDLFKLSPDVVGVPLAITSLTPEAFRQRAAEQLTTFATELYDSGFPAGDIDRLIADAVAAKAVETGQPELIEALAQVSNGLTTVGDSDYARQNLNRFKQEAKAIELQEERRRYQEGVVMFRVGASLGTLDEARLNDYRESNPDVISDREAESLKVQNRQAIVQAEAKAARLQGEEQFKLWREQVKSEVAESMAVAGDSGLGAIQFRGRTFSYEDDNGKLHQVEADQLLEEIIGDTMQRIGQQAQENGTDPLPLQIEYLSTNGSTFDPWKQLADQGFLSLATAEFTDPDSPIPPAGATAFELWKSLGAANESLRDEHFSNAKARELFELAEVYEQWHTPGEPAVALLLATKATTDDDYRARIARQFDRESFEDAVGSLVTSPRWFGKDANNSTEMAGELQRLAESYTRLGLSPDKALSQAHDKLKKNYRIVNGWAINTGNANTPPEIEDAAPLVIEDLKRANNINLGLDPEDLTLIPTGPQGNAWIVVDGFTLQPASGDPINPFVYTSRQLTDRLQQDRDNANAKQLSADTRRREGEQNRSIDTGFTMIDLAESVGIEPAASSRITPEQRRWVQAYREMPRHQQAGGIDPRDYWNQYPGGPYYKAEMEKPIGIDLTQEEWNEYLKRR